MTWHLDDYRCTLLRGILRRSFQETSPRNTAENIVKHRDGSVGSVVANHRGGGETSMVITTLITALDFTNVFIPNAVSSLDCLLSEVTVRSCIYLWCIPCYRARYRPSLKIYNNDNNNRDHRYHNNDSGLPVSITQQCLESRSRLGTVHWMQTLVSLQTAIPLFI